MPAPVTFFQNTRLYTARLEQKSKPTGGGVVSWTLPKTGILAAVLLRINASVSGTLSSPNALGMASIIRNVRLITNASVNLINISGAGYFYALAEFLETGQHATAPIGNGRAAVTAASNQNLDMWLPIALNMASTAGLLVLQNEQTSVTLTVEFEADATVATGATVTATVEPVLFFYTVPVGAKLTDFDVLHVIEEETQTVAATGTVEYPWPVGTSYVGLYHTYGAGASGTDKFTQVQLKVGENQYPYTFTPEILDAMHLLFHGRTRPKGLIGFDLIGWSGQGTFGLPRDVINTAMVTSVKSVITASATDTLRTIRRQLLVLP